MAQLRRLSSIYVGTTVKYSGRGDQARAYDAPVVVSAAELDAELANEAILRGAYTELIGPQIAHADAWAVVGDPSTWRNPPENLAAHDLWNTIGEAYREYWRDRLDSHTPTAGAQ